MGYPLKGSIPQTGKMMLCVFVMWSVYVQSSKTKHTSSEIVCVEESHLPTFKLKH